MRGTVAAALLLAAAPAPLPDCPPGTVLMGARPPEGTEAWCRQPGDGPEVREGTTRAYYAEDGLPHRELTYRRGKLHGPFREWYRGGQLAVEGTYEDDLRSGTWRYFQEDGALAEECGWRRDLRHGVQVRWYPDGRKRGEGRWCAGTQCGRWTEWGPDGRITSQTDFEVMRDAP